MTDWKDRQGGGYTASVGQLPVLAATSHVAVPTANNRLAVALHNAGANPLYINYGAAATSTRSFPIIPSACLIETNYLGQIQVAVASGAATGLLAVKDIAF